MSTTAHTHPAEGDLAAAADPSARKEGAAEVLRIVFGGDVVAALREGFLQGGDFTAVVPLLVGTGAKPHLAAAARGALAAACDAGKAGAAALLLECDGVRAEDANAGSTYVNVHGIGGYSLLSAAARRGDAGVVGALVRSGKADVGKPDASGHLPLVEAANSGNAACVEVLLAAPGIDANQADDNGERALSIAAFNGHLECLQALLRAAGIDAAALDEGEDKTALMWAANQGHTDCLRALLAAGVDPDQADGEGTTALTEAAYGDSVECIHALVAAGADVNQGSTGGWTALDGAAAINSTGAVRALVAVNGIDLGHSDLLDGFTALHNACSHQNAEMTSLLLVAGGCRFALEAAPATTRRVPLELADDSKEGKAVRAVFLSGVDYWQRTRHGGHSWAMRQVVLGLMLTRQRLDNAAPQAPAAHALVHLPEEIWLLMLGFLRSADFPPHQ